MKKKHELLKHAYDNYPKGTKFITLLEKTSHRSTGVFELNEEDFNSIADANTGQYIYEYGKWAEIVPDKVFVMTSEEGIPLYVGDDSYVPQLHLGSYTIARLFKVKMSNKTDLNSKFFSTKEAAQKWIAEQNKPNEVEVKLFNNIGIATITKDKIKISDAYFSYFIKPSDLEDMLHAYKSLQ